MQIAISDLVDLIQSGAEGDFNSNSVRFRIREPLGSLSPVVYSLTPNGIFQKENKKIVPASLTVSQLLLSELVILPETPSKNSKYWSLHESGGYTVEFTWTGSGMDYIRLEAGLVYKTKSELERKAGKLLLDIINRWE